MNCRAVRYKRQNSDGLVNVFEVVTLDNRVRPRGERRKGISSRNDLGHSSIGWTFDEFLRPYFLGLLITLLVLVVFVLNDSSGDIR